MTGGLRCASRLCVKRQVTNYIVTMTIREMGAVASALFIMGLCLRNQNASAANNDRFDRHFI